MDSLVSSGADAPAQKQIDADWLLRHPRLSTLHSVLFIVFIWWFFYEFSSFRFPYENVDSIKKIKEIDSLAWYGIKYSIVIAILLSAVRIYISFFLLEHDIGFKYVIHPDCAQTTKAFDFFCRAAVSSTTLWVMIIGSGLFGLGVLPKGPGVPTATIDKVTNVSPDVQSLGLLFAFMSLLSWLWDNLILNQLRTDGRMLREIEQNPLLLSELKKFPLLQRYIANNPVIMAAERDSSLPQTIKNLDAFRCWKDLPALNAKLEHLNKFTAKVLIWRRVDLAFLFFFACETILISYLHYFNIHVNNPILWAGFSIVVVGIIARLEVYEIINFRKELYRLLKFEFKHPEDKTLVCASRQVIDGAKEGYRDFRATPLSKLRISYEQEESAIRNSAEDKW